MSAIAPATDRTAPDWNAKVAALLKANDPWAAYVLLMEARQENGADLSLRGYLEIVRNLIVRNFVGNPNGMRAVPRLTAEFLNAFDRFNLTAQEGFLMSLIDGRLDLQKLLMVSPFDPFSTLFYLAKLEQQRAITVPA
jgi:hypothetical protein